MKLETKRKTVEYKGEIMTVNEVAKILDLSYYHVSWQLKCGATIEEIEEKTKIRRRGGKTVKHNGKDYTYKEFSALTGIGVWTVRRKARLGKTPEQIIKEHNDISNTEKYDYYGEMLTIKQISEYEGVGFSTARKRVINGKYVPIKNPSWLWDGVDEKKREACESGNNKTFLDA